MKKLIISVLAAMISLTTVWFGVPTDKVFAANEWSVTVSKGVMDDLVPIGHMGGSYGNASEYGSKLIPVAEYGLNRGIWELSLGGGWGSRYYYDYAIDLDGFGITLDFTHANADSEIAVIFGADKGEYLNIENGGFGIKIIKHDELFGVVVSNAEHDKTIQTMTPKPSYLPWDSRNTGYTVNSDGGLLTISFNKQDGDFILKLNSEEFVLPSSEVTGILGSDTSNVHVGFGAVSDPTEIVRVVRMKENVSSAYDRTVPGIAGEIDKYVKAASGVLNTPEKIVEAESLGENAGFERLLRHDQRYFAEEIAAAQERIATARAALSAEGKIKLLKSDVVKLKKKLDDAVTNSAFDEALAYAAKIKEKDIDAIGEISGADKEEFDAAVSLYESVLATTEAARKRVVKAYVTEFEKLAADMSGVEDLKKVENLRNEIYVNLVKLSRADRNEVAVNLADIQERITERMTLNGWTASDGALIYNGGKYFEFSSVGDAGSATYGEKIKVNDMKISVAVKNSGGWVAVSLSNKAEPFHYSSRTDADVEEMQSNPSLVIMMHVIGDNRLGIEVFLIKSTHTSIYGATRGNMIIPYTAGDNVNIEIKADNEANSTYSNIFINGQKFTGTQVKNSELKLAIGKDFKGYLSVVKNGNASIKADKINGYDATSDKIANLPGSEPDNPVDSSKGDSSGDNSSSGENSSSGGKKVGCKSQIALPFVGSVAILIAGAVCFMIKRKNGKIND